MPVVKIDAQYVVSNTNEAYLLHLKWAVVRNQPLSVIIAALSSEFQSYHGRLHGALQLDVHQPRRVLVVGYGTTKQGIRYWIVKNLWPCGARAAGAKKATSGCSATSANKGGLCGITTYTILPTAAAAAAY